MTAEKDYGGHVQEKPAQGRRPGFDGLLSSAAQKALAKKFARRATRTVSDCQPVWLTEVYEREIRFSKGGAVAEAPRFRK